MMSQSDGSAPAGTRAIVIGGSIAGLTTAHALSAHFDNVTILERDTFPEGAGSRKGVPQGRHIHVLLARGKQALEELFPGLQDELGRAGAPWLDVGTDLAWLLPAGWKQSLPSRITGRAFSRDFLESTIRRRVQANPKVRVVEEADVSGLLHDADHGRVTGVRYRLRNADGSEQTMNATLVADASGRHSKAAQWLQSLGYPVPDQTVINSFFGYASRFYEPPPGFKATWKALYIQIAAPHHLRGGVVLPTEGQRWIVTLGGMGKQYPPTDEAGFIDYARSLRSPLLYEAIKDARPLTPIVGYRGTENQLRHYERLARRPENFVLLGDAVCAFNPVYGQGMTTATLGAIALGETLAEQARTRPGDLTGLAARFQKKLAANNAVPWLVATGEDFRCPITEGGKPDLRTRIALRYFARVLARATTDPLVCEAALEMLHLLRPPAALFAPGFLLRVMLPRSSGAKATAPTNA
jgi:2-polyprenyl-6-methoxyphenol hydroxylase-like FAD-dependent oxidoreductase